jgi:hypothetical protein
MAHGVDTAVKGEQPAGDRAAMNRVLPQPQRNQLLVGDHPVLAIGDLRDQAVNATRVTLIAYIATNVTRVVHPARLAREALRVGADR